MCRFASILSLSVFLLVAQQSRSQTPEPIGPYGGYIRALAAGPGAVVYAGTEFGGVFRTDNDGQSWTQVYDFALIDGPVSFRSLAVEDNGNLLAGTDGYGLLQFDGSTWQRPFTVLYDRSITSILPRPNGDLFVGTGDGLYWSSDNQVSYSVVKDVPRSSITALHGSESGSLFAAAYFNGLHRSDDGGATWFNIMNGLPEPVWAITTDGPAGSIYVSAGSEIYVSTDAGATWVPMNAPRATYASLVILQHNGPEVFGSTVSINDAAGGGIVFTSDAGVTWVPQTGLPNLAMQTIVNPRDLLIVGGTLGLGVYGKEDWGSSGGFELRNSGLNNTDITVIAETTDRVETGGLQTPGHERSLGEQMGQS